MLFQIAAAVLYRQVKARRRQDAAPAAHAAERLAGANALDLSPSSHLITPLPFPLGCGCRLSRGVLLKRASFQIANAAFGGHGAATHDNDD